VESKWKNYHITTFPGQSLSKTGLSLEEAMDLSRDRQIEEKGLDERSALRPGRFISGEIALCTCWMGERVGPRDGLHNKAKIKFSAFA
jgi:hypothetical protein